VLDSILGGSASSRLFQEIREKRGMAYSVYSYQSEYSDTGQIGVYVGTREDNLGECMEITAHEIGEIAHGRINDREIRRAKDSLKGRILLTMESTGARMNRLGRAILTDSEILSVERLEAEIEAVTAEGVAELAALLLAPEKLSVAGIGLREDKFRDAIARIDLDRKAAA
jgi:predicted Zn-dependent peptidase